MDIATRVELVNKILGVHSIFKHMLDDEEVTIVSVEYGTDHAEYSWSYKSGRNVGKSSVRIDLDTDENKGRALTVDVLLFDSAYAQDDYHTTAENTADEDE